MERGFFKLWRSWFDDPVFQDPNLWKVFCWAWGKASHEDKYILWRTGRGRTTIKIDRGQFVFGRFTAAQELRMRPFSVYKRIVKLEKLGKLSVKENTHYSIITMDDYEVFQPRNKDKRTGKGTPKEHPRNTKEKLENLENL